MPDLDERIRSALHERAEPASTAGVVERLVRRRRRRRLRRAVALACTILLVGGGGVVARDTLDDDPVRVTTRPGPPSTPSDRDPASLAVTEMGSGLAGMAVRLGADGPWTARGMGDDPASYQLVRLDPETGDDALTAAVDHPVADIDVAEGRVWAVGGGDGAVPISGLSRVDATGGPVASRAFPEGISAYDVAAGLGFVWVLDVQGHEVLKIDVSTLEVLSRFPVPHAAGRLAVAFDQLWIAGPGSVTRFDGEGTELGVTSVPGARALAPSDDGVWVLGSDATAARLDPSTGSVGLRIDLPIEASVLAATSQGLWAAAPGAVALVAFDGDVVGTGELVTDEVPTAIAAEDGVAWVAVLGAPWLARVDGPGVPARRPEVPAVERRSFGTERVERPEDPASAAGGNAVLTDIRVAHHEDYDRLVVQFEDRLPGRYSIGLTAEPATGDCTDPGVDGPSYLSLSFGAGTLLGQSERVRPVSSLINELVVTCEREGWVHLALGMQRRAPFRVLALEDPVRLAIDVRTG